MPLIKRDNSSQLAKSAVVLDLGDLQREAERIIEQAEDEAKRIIAEANQTAAELNASAGEEGYKEGQVKGHEEGRAEGLKEGRTEAKDEVQARLRSITESWDEALQHWEDERSAMLLAAREDVLIFAFSLARKVVGRVVETTPEVVRDQLAETLARLNRPTSVSVAINPADRPLIEEVLPELAERIIRCEHVEIQEDASISRGGCVVRTASGHIDATIEKQLDRLAESLLPGRGPEQEIAEEVEATAAEAELPEDGEVEESAADEENAESDL